MAFVAPNRTVFDTQDDLIAYNLGYPHTSIRANATAVELIIISRGYLVCTFLNGNSIEIDSIATYDGLLLIVNVHSLTVLVVNCSPFVKA